MTNIITATSLHTAPDVPVLEVNAPVRHLTAYTADDLLHEERRDADAFRTRTTAVDSGAKGDPAAPAVACGSAPHALRGAERGQHLAPHQGLKAPQPRCCTRGQLCIERGVLGGTAASAALGGPVDAPSSFSFSLSLLLTFSLSLFVGHLGRPRLARHRGRRQRQAQEREHLGGTEAAQRVEGRVRGEEDLSEQAIHIGAPRHFGHLLRRERLEPARDVDDVALLAGRNAARGCVNRKVCAAWHFAACDRVRPHGGEVPISNSRP